jgi:hypothetical protein
MFVLPNTALILIEFEYRRKFRHINYFITCMCLIMNNLEKIPKTDQNIRDTHNQKINKK